MNLQEVSDGYASSASLGLKSRGEKATRQGRTGGYRPAAMLCLNKPEIGFLVFQSRQRARQKRLRPMRRGAAVIDRSDNLGRKKRQRREESNVALTASFRAGGILRTFDNRIRFRSSTDAPCQSL